MDEALHFGIFGDSLMKGTLPGERRYQFHMEFMDDLLAQVHAVVVNKARFGATIRKGRTVLERDLSNGSRYDYALLEYGGNDCNYDWPSVARDPDGTHDPAVSLEEFTDTLSGMVDTLLAHGAQPFLMTLPPIDSKKYLDYLRQGGVDSDAVLHWLRDVNRIYRTQELYSDAVYKLSVRRALPCVDVRAAFLQRADFIDLLSDDGIHPSEAGYTLLYTTLIDAITRQAQTSAAC